MNKREAKKRAQAASNRQQRRFLVFRGLGNRDYEYGPLEDHIDALTTGWAEIVDPTQCRMPQGVA